MPSSGSYGSRRSHSRTVTGYVNSSSGRPRPSTVFNRSQAGTAASQDEQPKKDRRRRVLAYYTHAIVTFHTFGIPLSTGLTLEYYHNSLFLTTPLKQLSLVVAIQWVGIFALEQVAAGTYRWKHWRWSYFAVSLVVILSHVVMARGARPWGLSMGMRALTGLCLGFLRSMTLRCLASHYKNNITEVSMQSGAAGLLGALVHSAVAWSFLRMDDYKSLAWANFYIVLFTVGPTLGGLFPATEHEIVEADASKHSRSIPRLRHRKSTRANHSLPGKFGTQTNSALTTIGDCCLLVGYFLVFAFIFVWPTFFPLLLSSRPINEYPEYAAYWVMGTFGAGTLTTAFFAHSWPRRGLGVVNTFTAAAILAGCLSIIAAWVIHFWVWGVISVLYGLCLGPLLALHRKVFDLLCKYWTRMRLFPAGLGVVAFGGISVAGLMIQSSGGGSVALTVSGAVMLAGGCCMAFGKWLRYPAKYVVI